MRRSAFRARPHGGRHDSSERRGARARRPRPTQTLHAKVRFSWISLRSSNKTPTSRNATQTTGPRSTIPLDRVEPKFRPARPSLALMTTRPAGKPGHQFRHIIPRSNRAACRPAPRNHAQVGDWKNRSKLSYNRKTKSLCHRITRETTFTRDILATQALKRTDSGDASTMQTCI